MFTTRFAIDVCPSKMKRQGNPSRIPVIRDSGAVEYTCILHFETLGPIYSTETDEQITRVK